MNIQSMYRPPYGPRFHFDEAGAGGGGAAKPWYDGKADAETIGWLQNKGWDKDPVTAAIEASKARREAERFLGSPPEQLLKLPKDASDEAGWSAVRQRLGMPKEAKEYDFSGVKFSDGTELEQSFTDTMRAALHRAGVAKDSAPEVAKAVVKFMDDAERSEKDARTATLQADRAQLQKDWGSNFEFNRLTAMQGAKRAVGGNEEQASQVIAAMEQALGYKATMEFWRKIGAGTTEDTFVESGHSGNPTTLNGARARLADLQSDPDWVKRYLAGESKARQEADNLQLMIHGAAA